MIIKNYHTISEINQQLNKLIFDNKVYYNHDAQCSVNEKPHII